MKIAIDVCNTIADVLAKLVELLGPNPNPANYQFPGATPEFFERHPEVFSGALPVPGAVQGVKNLAREWKVVYLSSRPAWARQMTERWLSQWGFPPAPLILADNKAEAALRMGIDLAIDDAPHHIRAFMENSIPVLTIAQPYNRGFPCRINWAVGRNTAERRVSGG